MNHLLRRIVRASIGLVLCAFGIHLTVQANIGLAPWDAFAMGLSFHLPVSYGTASMYLSLIILLIDLLMREHIGLGTLLDAVITGQSLNLFEWLNLVPRQTNPWAGAALMVLGMFILSFSQFVYMSAGLCCGPRDALLVGLGRRLSRLPIGLVSLLLLAFALAAAVALGGPIGIGTLLCAVGMGASMQITFRVLRFEPRRVNHVGFAEMLARYRGKA